MNKLLFSLLSVVLVFNVGVQAVQAAKVDYDSAYGSNPHLAKWNGELYLFSGTNGNGAAMHVFKRTTNKHGEGKWKDVSGQTQFKRLLNEVDYVHATITFKDYVFADVDLKGDGNYANQIWRRCKNCAGKWEKTGADVIGKAQSNHYGKFFILNDNLYVLFKNNLGSRLYTTSNGSDWAQVGEQGFGQDLVLESVMTVPASEYVLAVGSQIGDETTGVNIYRSSASDLSQWELVATENTVLGADTAEGDYRFGNLNAGYLVATDNDGVAPVRIYQTIDGEAYQQVGDAGLAADEFVVFASWPTVINDQLYVVGGSIYTNKVGVYKYNETSGWSKVVNTQLSIYLNTQFDSLATDGDYAYFGINTWIYRNIMRVFRFHL